MDLATRLEKLEILLGKPVCLAEPKEGDLQLRHDERSECDSSDALQSAPAQDSLQCTKEPHESSTRAAKHEQAFDCSNFHPGEPVDEEFCFCPLKVMVRYPEHFIGKTNKPRAKPYFDRILLGKTWDIFYLHDPAEPLRDPYLLVPTAQFVAFLDTVNDDLNISLRIPKGGNEHRFYMKFGQGGTPRPRYLRRSRDETSLDVRPWPQICQADIDSFGAATVYMQDEWREKMKIVRTGFARQDKWDKDARRKLKHTERKQMLLQAQTYLGLKGTSQLQDMIFVCVDVEAIERPPNPVSEIGFAILDTKDVLHTRPGLCGENWRTVIKCHHLRVWEYSGLRNSRFVQGCPDAFDFGTSEFPRKSHVREEIMKILTPYIDTDRPIILVGHDIQCDITWVSTFGIDLLSLRNFSGLLDTKDMFQGWRNEKNPRGLGRVLEDLDIPSKNLHNAGNDAYYTVCAMLGIAFEEVRKSEDTDKAEENGLDQQQDKHDPVG
ncbi:hypothetical protein BGZ63DRAFT_437148 [Mariannaea sp. PMI_226]|nr:hypothetical protein BGZ63DRAFT_437148 [Mariannaea sp. PMI_226]